MIEVKQIFIPDDDPPQLSEDALPPYLNEHQGQPRYVGCEGKIIIASGEDAHLFC